MGDYIYIIVAQTGTRPARLFKHVTKKPYNHVSLSGDLELSEMYSFCRVTSEKMKYLNSSIQ